MSNLIEWSEYIKLTKKLNSRKLPVKYKAGRYRATQDNEQYFITNILDLHGLTQDLAYNALKNFLIKAYENNLGKVLVITGKGKGENVSAIKLALPRWLEYTEIHKYINSYAPANYKQGGEGAMIITIKKNKEQEYGL